MSADRIPEAPSRCAALPYRVRNGAAEVLLITRRGRGAWIIPKGKVERSLGPAESARREALEEAGVEGEVDPAPFDQYRHGGGDDDPLVSVFLLRVTRELSTWPEAGARDRAWMRAQDAAAQVTDPGLARVLAEAAGHIAAKRVSTPTPPLAAAAADVAGAAREPARRRLTPFRAGVVLLAVIALAAWALTSWRSGRHDGSDARLALRADADTGKKTDGRPPASVVGALAPGDSACRVVGAPVALSDQVHEASGVAAGRRTPGVVWTHNDSGEPVVYAFAVDGTALGAVRVAGAAVEDWEDIAAGPCPGGSCLYLADIGDNGAARAGITVYRVPEPVLTDAQTRPAEAFHATYPDGPHDAEALFVLPDGGIYIVTKGETGPIALYRFPQPLRAGASVGLERIVELGPAGIRRRDRITSASASPDGRWVALRTLDALDLYRTAALTGGTLGTPIHVDLRPLDEAQGEGVGWGPSGTVYLSSEGGRKSNPATLSRLSCTLGS